MLFVQNRPEEQQLSLFDPLNTLTEREKKFLDRSWAKYFAEFIFPRIDETPYAVLYSDKDSRPNTPVNVQIGALLIKELTNLSDDELLESRNICGITQKRMTGTVSYTTITAMKLP